MKPREAYFSYLRRRSGSYFQVERQGRLSEDRKSRPAADASLLEPEGYSEIAAQVVESLAGVQPRIIPINVRNNGTLSCLAANDVVEVQSLVDSNGIHPFSVSGALPPTQRRCCSG